MYSKFAAFAGASAASQIFDDSMIDHKNNLKDEPKPYPWTIHVTPHSHDDVGWLKTLNQYFDGSRKDIQFTNVNIELSTVMDALSANPERKFTEVEIAFFKKWWDNQTAQKHEQVKGLVANGQLEFINAGWSMHDEAGPIYDDMIDNMMVGQQFIKDTFGVAPRVGW